MSLCKCFTHDLRGDALDLDIHLQCGDALFSSGDLEVHIAEVIFSTLDIGQDHIVFAFLDEAHGDTCDRGLDRHTGIHQCQRGTADGTHG